MIENNYYSQFTDFDIELFKAGKHYLLYNHMGAHVINKNGTTGVYFSVWAPNARYVSVIGNFNSWNRGSHQMNVRWDQSGIWELFVPGLQSAEYYKYYVEGNNGYMVEKADPYAYHSEMPPATASVTWDLSYKWGDRKWLQQRDKQHVLTTPLSIYELHLGSWRRKDDGRMMTYREIAGELSGYCKYMGYTHVELMPIAEHPFYGSWGYQVTGYFAPTSRYGTPQDFMYLVDTLHKNNIGVILDWVPSHFPSDEHGLGYFDGAHVYEHSDPRKGFHKDWQSLIFDYGRAEVRAFLISNALFWLDKYHIDGLRVDAVASMLYLDYSRNEGEWLPNEYGGRENLDAISFLKEFNNAVHTHHPDVLTIAEESTAWPGVTHCIEDGGLGFDLKWMMGWMNDTLKYFETDPVFRKYAHDKLTFNIYYAFTEKFLLPLSHDEVVYGKHSLLDKMPGDEWQKFANLRLLFAYMYTHPGAKMLFMGGEFAQQHEWRHDFSLDWDNNLNSSNTGVQNIVRDLNMLYAGETPLHGNNYSPEGYEWIDYNDRTNSVLCWMRKGIQEGDNLVVIANFTPVVHRNYRVGSPSRGYYHEVFNSDASKYGGSNVVNEPLIDAYPIPMHGLTHSFCLVLPPLALIILKKAD